MPSTTVTSIVPSPDPLQETFVNALTEATNPLVGPSTVTLVVSVHPFASFTVNVYVPATTLNKGDATKEVPSMLYVYGVVPPVVPVTEIDPCPSPKQTTGVVVISPTFVLNDKTAGCPTAVPVDPSKSITHDVLTASLIDIWNVPANNDEKAVLVCHVVPLSFEYSYVPAPPVAAVTAIDPVEVPLHVASVTEIEAVNTSNWVIVADVLAVHAFASVTVTVYVPAVKPVISCEVDAAPSSHK